MKSSQSLNSLTSNIILGLENILIEFNPKYVFVHGDTTTTMVSSLAAFYNRTKICHIEAGLRTYNKYSPYPEEINRQIVSKIADINFAPTKEAEENLINEKINPNSIHVTGNTVIDALISSIDNVNRNPSELIKNFSSLIENKEMILVTGHRRENHGQGIINICNAIKRIAIFYPKKCIVFPVHLN